MSDNEKIDIAVWTKNGNRSMQLTTVLSSIEIALGDRINNRIAIDDGSTDGTISVLWQFGWKVYPNLKGGVGNAANQALALVTTPYFASFEQDVVVAEDWLRVFKSMDDKTACVRGMRYANCSPLREMEMLPSSAQCSIDNNLWNTAIVRKLGGFPVGHFTDAIMKEKIIVNGYKWIDDKSIVSMHLRNRAWTEIRHDYRLGIEEIITGRDRLRHNLGRLAFSPVRAVQLYKNGVPISILLVYPAMRFSHVVGNLRGVLRRQNFITI